MREFSGKEFDGHLAAEAGVISEVNLAHPALADGRADLIATKCCADWKGH